MATQIQIRRDTAANWTTNDPTLAEGELGMETDTLKIKMGDGVAAWTALEYGLIWFYGAITAIVAHGDLGATHTLDMGVSNQHSGTVDQDTTISITDPGVDCVCRIRLTKSADATARAITIQKTGGGGTFVWANNTALESLTQNAGVYDIVLWRVAADTYDCSYLNIGF
jgi:hypothetical protein